MRPSAFVAATALFAVGAAHSAEAQHVDSLETLRARTGLAVRGPEGPVGFDPLAWTSARAQVTGTLRILVVPTLFADSDTLAAGPDHFQNVFFDGASGTLPLFFPEASGGMLQAAGASVPGIRTSIPWE